MNMKKDIEHGFLPNYKIELLTANNPYIPVMEYVYIKDGFAYATDSRILVKANLHVISTFDDNEINLLNGKFISKSTFKLLRKSDYTLITEDGYEIAIGEAKLNIKFDEVDGTFPNADNVIHSSFDRSRVAVEQIGINAHFVELARKALGGKKHTFNFYGPTQAIRIWCEDNAIDRDDIIVLIMPILPS